MRLIESLCNGCSVEINETGTGLKFKPGFIRGGKVEHKCSTGRSIGWYLEGVIGLLPFSKAAVTLNLHGITNDDIDMGYDTFKEVTVPLLAHFGLSEGVTVKVKKRGAPPAGGGLITFKCPTIRSLLPVHLTKVRSISLWTSQ